MGELITRNLLHRPLRTLIGIMAVAVKSRSSCSS